MWSKIPPALSALVLALAMASCASVTVDPVSERPTSQMPDELLSPLHRAYTEAETAEVADIVYRRIHGHDPPNPRPR